MKRAYEEGLTVVPIGIHGTHRVLPVDAGCIAPGQPVAVRVGAALEAERFTSAHDFSQACWATVRVLHREAKSAIAFLESSRAAPESSDPRADRSALICKQ